MASTTPGRSAAETPASSVAPSNDELNADTSPGTTEIEDSVIAKIAATAARDVKGVHDLGGAAARALGALRDRVGQDDDSQGVTVEVSGTEIAVHVTLVADHPVPLQDVAAGVRKAVVDAVERLTSLQVTGVDVTIADIAVPSEDDDDRSSRLR